LTREQHQSPADAVENPPVPASRDGSTESTARAIPVRHLAQDLEHLKDLPHPRAAAPERFGRYVLLERMGEGGMAEVFRAVVPGAEGFRREVVLKRILASHARAPAFVEMFAQEARISALLHHPNIVQVFDFGQVDGSYFLAMELLDGWEVGAITKALRAAHAKMPIEVALHIAHEVLLGLAYAHTLKVQGHHPLIIHRDVSPSNIMCLRTGGVKLLDFGVASVTGVGAAGPLGAKPAFCGKLSYAAPEYVQGHGLDARIDLFAVGVILWEMLVGERLFRSQSDQQTLQALLVSPILAPSIKRPAVSAEIDRIVMKALERDPAQRYQTAAEMAEDLEQVLSERRYQSQMLPRLLANLFGEDTEERSSDEAVEELIQSGATIPPVPPSAERRLAPSLSDRWGWGLRFLGGVGAALALLVLVFLAVWSRPPPPARPLRSPAPPPAAVARVKVRAPETAFVVVPLPLVEPPKLSPLPPVPPLTAPPAPPSVRVQPPEHPHATAAQRLRVQPTAKRKAVVRRTRAVHPVSAHLTARERPVDPILEAMSTSRR
jgi:serine/threonine protein kinase